MADVLGEHLDQMAQRATMCEPMPASAAGYVHSLTAVVVGEKYVATRSDIHERYALVRGIEEEPATVVGDSLDDGIDFDGALVLGHGVLLYPEKLLGCQHHTNTVANVILPVGIQALDQRCIDIGPVAAAEVGEFFHLNLPSVCLNTITLFWLMQALSMQVGNFATLSTTQSTLSGIVTGKIVTIRLTI
jgi:hypothetical protein